MADGFADGVVAGMASNDRGYGYPAMPMVPMYGGGFGGNGYGFGGDWIWIIILFALFGNGGFGGFGGFGGGLGIDFPWLLNGQNGINNNVSDGFRTAQLQDSITSVRDGISNLSTQLCGCCSDMQMSMMNGFNNLGQQLNANEIANLNRSFAEQMANAAGFNSVNSNLCDIRYSIATEGAATRAAGTANTQAILDKLCQLELDGVKGQLAQAQRENVGLQNQLNIATLRESQTAQNAFIASEINQQNETFYNRLMNCPVPSTPVYGRTPIFTCPNNNTTSCSCGCGNN